MCMIDTIEMNAIFTLFNQFESHKRNRLVSSFSCEEFVVRTWENLPWTKRVPVGDVSDGFVSLRRENIFQTKSKLLSRPQVKIPDHTLPVSLTYTFRHVLPQKFTSIWILEFGNGQWSMVHFLPVLPGQTGKGQGFSSTTPIKKTSNKGATRGSWPYY